MIPMDKRKMASMIVHKREGEHNMAAAPSAPEKSSDQHMEALRAISSDMMDAIHAKDHNALAHALYAAHLHNEMREDEPESE